VGDFGNHGLWRPPQGDNIFLVKICSGRKFGTRLKEHKTEVEFITSKPFTRNQRASSLSEQNKSPLTDHASHDNHVINWPASTILDRESDKSTRWIKEADRQYIFGKKDGSH